LVGHWWRVEHPRATVIIAHGLFDHVGIYLKLVNFLLREGFDVFAVDFPGHGVSDGPSAEIDDFQGYADVIDLCVERVLDSDKTRKIYLIGQSTGGAAVAHYLLTGRFKSVIEKSILMAPLFRPKSWWSVNLSWLLLHRFISHFPRRFAVNSSDKVFLNFLANKDPLQPRRISMRWLAAMRRWVKTLPALPSGECSVLIIQGDDDGTVDWKKNIPVFQSRFPRCELVMLEGAKHHLVNESPLYREKIQSAIRTFLSS